MNLGGCNSLQLSVQLSAMAADQPVNLTAEYLFNSVQGQLGNQVQTLPVGVTPFPLGPVPANAVGFLFLNNLDETNQVYVSTNPDGSAPFAKVLAGEPLVLPAMPNVNYYLRVDSQPIEVVALAMSS